MQECQKFETRQQYTGLNLATEDMLTLTCCQDHILTENIWFVCSETSYSGDERRCHYAGQTNNEQLKIELLSQWKLEAESRNYLFLSDDSRVDSLRLLFLFVSICFHLFLSDDSRVDYLGLLGSEDRARRFSEEVIDRKGFFFCLTFFLFNLYEVSFLLSILGKLFQVQSLNMCAVIYLPYNSILNLGPPFVITRITVTAVKPLVNPFLIMAL